MRNLIKIVALCIIAASCGKTEVQKAEVLSTDNHEEVTVILEGLQDSIDALHIEAIESSEVDLVLESEINQLQAQLNEVLDNQDEILSIIKEHEHCIIVLKHKKHKFKKKHCK